MSKIVIFSYDFPATSRATGFIRRFNKTDNELIESLGKELVSSYHVAGENIHIKTYANTFEVKGGENLSFLVSPSRDFIDNVEISPDIKKLVDEGESVGWAAYVFNGKVSVEFIHEETAKNIYVSREIH